MRAEERKRVWVNPFQTGLALRIVAYLVLTLAVGINILFAWKLAVEGVNNPAEQFVEMIRDYFPVAACLLLLMPVMAWDAIRFSHRLVGPLVRFRRTMQTIAEGKPVTPIKLREGDYLTDLRDDFNRMLDALQRRGLPVLKPKAEEDETPQSRPA